MKKIIFGLLSLSVLKANELPAMGQNMLNIPASVLYEEGLHKNLRLTSEGDLELINRVLLENDSPGAGKVLPKETGNIPSGVNSSCWIQKKFYIEGALPTCCRLAIEVCAAPATALRVVLNNYAIELLPPVAVTNAKPRYCYHAPAEGHFYGWASRSIGWFYADLPVAHLTSGWNTIVLQGMATQTWQIARADYSQYQKGSAGLVSDFPHTSAIMSNAPDGAWEIIDGEWGVRLSLGKYASKGTLESPVIDLAGSDDLNAIKQPGAIDEFKFHIESDCPKAAGLEIEMRSGVSPFYRPALWGTWRGVAVNEPIALHRYAQWRLTLHSHTGERSPRITGLHIKASKSPAPVTWSAATRLQKFDNPTLIAGPLEYRYENYNLPELQRLRRDWELDACVAGAKSDFEIMRALMRWAYLIPMKDFTANDWPLPDLSWNALDYLLLERTADGAIKLNTYKTRRRDLFCMTSNLVLMQALLAFGIPARYMTINGHEVCEAWSNEHSKWIYLDATRDFYYADRSTGTPLHIFEVMRLSQQFPDRLEMIGAPNPYTLESSNTETITRDMEGFRMILRNNFIAQRFPVPLNPGYHVPWPWNGYLNWETPEKPVLHAAHTSGRVRDFYWTLNLVRLALEYDQTPGVIKVWADTQTPGLIRLLKSVDDGAWVSTSDNWVWRLRRGENKLRVCTENSLGRRGPVSTVQLLWP